MNKEEEKTALTTNVSEKKSLTPSERFLGMVLKNFGSVPGELKLAPFHQKLIQNYFIKMDMVLKTAEAKRLTKSEQYREALAYTWDNIDREKMSIDVVIFATLGIDPMQPNQINLIPYKNASTGKYDINFMLGYRGIELKATKYGLDVPDDVIIEVVYSNDEFRPFKKNDKTRVETYSFEIGKKTENPFDRGEVVGGFYYMNYFDAPEKNKLRLFSLADITKRIPKNASAEFWGGEKDNWKDGKKSGKLKVEGWFEEMVFKTISRAAYNSITIDSQKIDDNYVKLIQLEVDGKKTTEEKIDDHVNENTGSVIFDDHIEVEEPAAEQQPATGPASEVKKPVAEAKPKVEKKKTEGGGNGPGF